MSEDRRESRSSALQKVYDQLVDSAAKTVQFIRDNTGHAREQVQDLFQTTAEHVAEKTGEARRAIQLRMAIVEIEQHLNRLYPQIGKLLCDLIERQESAPLLDKDLRAKTELAAEYRGRLSALRRELETVPAPPKPQT
jgi:predicted membrane GTPase involved in stress response